jgi:hypothetical protein
MAAIPHVAMPLLDTGGGARSNISQRRKIALMVAGSMVLTVAAICGVVFTLPNNTFPTELVSKPKVGEGVGFHRAAHVFPPHVVKQMDLSVDPCDDFYKVKYTLRHRKRCHCHASFLMCVCHCRVQQQKFTKSMHFCSMLAVDLKST